MNARQLKVLLYALANVVVIEPAKCVPVSANEIQVLKQVIKAMD